MNGSTSKGGLHEQGRSHQGSREGYQHEEGGCGSCRCRLRGHHQVAEEGSRRDHRRVRNLQGSQEGSQEGAQPPDWRSDQDQGKEGTQVHGGQGTQGCCEVGFRFFAFVQQERDSESTGVPFFILPQNAVLDMRDLYLMHLRIMILVIKKSALPAAPLPI